MHNASADKVNSSMDKTFYTQFEYKDPKMKRKAEMLKILDVISKSPLRNDNGLHSAML